MQEMLSSLTQLARTGSRLADVAGSAKLYEIIIDFFIDGFECSEAAVYLKDAEGKTLIFVAGRTGDRYASGGEPLPVGQGLRGRAVATGKTQVVQETIAGGPSGEEESISEAVVPFRHDGEVIGVLDGISRTRKLRESDIPVFEVFGELVGAAVGRIRLRETLSDRTHKLSCLTKAGSVSSAKRSLNEQLGEILELLQDALNPEGCSVRLLTEDGMHLTVAAASGRDRENHEKHIPSDRGLFGFALSTGRPSMMPPPSSSPPVVSPEKGRYLSEMAVPLMYAGKALGALHLFHRKKDSFDDSDMLFAGAFADLAVAAVRRAQKHSSTTAKTAPPSLALFAETADLIARETDPEAMFRAVFDRISGPLGFIRAALLLPDAVGMLTEQVAAGVGGSAAGTRFSLEAGSAGQAFRTMETVFTAATPNDPESVAEIAAPLRRGDAPVGVLLVTPDDSVGERHVHAAELIAAQLSAAISGGRTIERLQASCARLDALNQAAFALNATLSLDSLLQEILRLAIKALRLERCAVLLIDEEGSSLVLEAAVGYGAAMGKKIPIGTGVTGAAASSGEPVYVEDTATDARYMDSGMRGRTEMAAPLTVRGKVIGVLDTESLTPGRFQRSDMDLFAAFAAHAATAVQNARLFNKLEAANLTLEENVGEMSRLNTELGEYSKCIYRINGNLESQLKNLTTIHEAGKTITSSLDLDTTLSAILEMTSQIIGSTAGAIKLLDEESKEFRTRAQSGSLTDVSSSCSILEVPLRIGDKKIGIFELVCKTQNGVGSDEQRMVETLASQAAIAIENARLFKSTQQIYYDTLKSLAQALEARDDYTRGHSERVARIAHRTAAKMELNVEAIQAIESAARLHDIGKIGIRDDVLLAARKLTDIELTAIREHSAFGNTILAPLKFLGQIRESVRHHHERWDGKGYPDGLGGTDIPMASRIIAVADAYDAMTSNRPYRESRTHDFAIKEIGAQAGKQFDPEVVSAFLKLVETVGEEGLTAELIP